MEWISVQDRLPDEKKCVLLICKNGAMFVGGWITVGYSKPEVQWRITTALSSTKVLNKGRVTHWMPLPDPPR